MERQKQPRGFQRDRKRRGREMLRWFYLKVRILLGTVLGKGQNKLGERQNKDMPRRAGWWITGSLCSWVLGSGYRRWYSTYSPGQRCHCKLGGDGGRRMGVAGWKMVGQFLLPAVFSSKPKRFDKSTTRTTGGKSPSLQVPRLFRNLLPAVQPARALVANS